MNIIAKNFTGVLKALVAVGCQDFSKVGVAASADSNQRHVARKGGAVRRPTRYDLMVSLICIVVIVMMGV